MKSLYEQDPTHWDKLANQGKPNLREVAKHFSRPFEMDKALGINSATSHWHNGRNGASKGSDVMAKSWLAQNTVKPNEQAEPVANTDTRMLLIVATPDQAAKIEKIAALIGAEVTDV